MGADAYLVRHDNKTMFDMGAAMGCTSLIDVFGGDSRTGEPVRRVVIPDAGTLAGKLAATIAGGSWDISEEELPDYCQRLAERIVRFAGGCRVDWLSVYETCCLNYTIVDARYSDSWDYFDVFRLLPQRTRRSIQSDRSRSALKRFDYHRSIGLSGEARKQFLSELRYAGKSPLELLAAAAPKRKSITPRRKNRAP